MAAAQTKGNEEDKHTGMQEKNKKETKNENEKKEARHKSKQARKSYSRRLHSNNLPVSAT